MNEERAYLTEEEKDILCNLANKSWCGHDYSQLIQKLGSGELVIDQPSRIQIVEDNFDAIKSFCDERGITPSSFNFHMEQRLIELAPPGVIDTSDGDF